MPGHDSRINHADVSPSPELSYIIGAVWGDGYTSLEKRNHTIGYYSIDEELMIHFNNCVEKIVGRKYPISPQKRSWPRPKGIIETYSIFRIRFGSKNLYEMIRSFERSKEVIEVFPSAFIRGFSDAEGCVEQVSHPRIILVNKKQELLLYIKDLLIRFFNIDSKLYAKKRGIYALRILSKDNVLRFKEHINFISKEKSAKLEVGWTTMWVEVKERKNFITENYGQKSMDNLVEATGLSKTTIYTYISRWNLPKGGIFHPRS